MAPKQPLLKPDLWVFMDVGGNPEMAKWAQNAVDGASLDRDKAMRLFRVLLPHATGIGGLEPRTASEAFKAFISQSSALSCQDYTFLFVALGREVGLKTEAQAYESLGRLRDARNEYMAYLG